MLILNAKILFIFMFIFFSFNAFSSTNCASGRVCFEFDERAIELPESYSLDTRYSVKEEGIRFSKYDGEILYSSPISRFLISTVAECGELCDVEFDGSDLLHRLQTYTDGRVFAYSWQLNNLDPDNWVGVIFTKTIAVTVYFDKEQWHKWVTELNLKKVPQ